MENGQNSSNRNAIEFYLKTRKAIFYLYFIPISGWLTKIYQEPIRSLDSPGYYLHPLETEFLIVTPFFQIYLFAFFAFLIVFVIEKKMKVSKPNFVLDFANALFGTILLSPLFWSPIH